jgi:hypothetical protein
MLYAASGEELNPKLIKGYFFGTNSARNGTKRFKVFMDSWL